MTFLMGKPETKGGVFYRNQKSGLLRFCAIFLIMDERLARFIAVLSKKKG